MLFSSFHPPLNSLNLVLRTYRSNTRDLRLPFIEFFIYLATESCICYKVILRPLCCVGSDFFSKTYFHQWCFYRNTITKYACDLSIQLALFESSSLDFPSLQKRFFSFLNNFANVLFLILQNLNHCTNHVLASLSNTQPFSSIVQFLRHLVNSPPNSPQVSFSRFTQVPVKESY